MKHALMAGVGLVALTIVVQPVEAADAPIRPTPPASDRFAVNWAGTYAGIVGSVGMMDSDLSDQWGGTTRDAPDMARWGGALGVTLGHNFQSGAFVYGVEADANWSGLRNSLTFTDPGNDSVTHRAKWDWYATLRGRMGLSVDRTLFYATGGVAFVGADYSSRYTTRFGAPADEGFSFDGTQVGFAAGVGVEHAFSPNLSFKAEYLYVGLPSVRRNYDNAGVVDPDEQMTWKSSAHLLRLGLNYRWGGASAQQPAALPVKAASGLAPPAVGWAGTYGGIVGSAGMMNSDMSDQWNLTAVDAPDMARWGGALGVTLGHNFQSGAFVYGVEADASWSGLRNSSTFTDPGNYSLTHRAKWDWYATLRGRMGLAADRTLLYATGGVAFVGVDYSSRYTMQGGVPNDEGFSFDGTQIGFAAGAGVEHAFSPNLSFKAEYLYVGLPGVRRNYDGGGGPNHWMTWKSSAHLLRLGLNYRWGGASAPQPVGPLANWAGTYGGIVGSVGVMDSDLSDQECATACDAPDMARWGGALGVTLGHNFQSGAFVYGVEADASWSGLRNSLTFTDPGNDSVTHRAKWDWYATLRGRMGLAADRTLLYATGGVAIVGVDYSSRYTMSGGPTDEGFSFDGTQVGFAAGVGVEHAFSPNLSFKAEYLYVGLPGARRNYDNAGVVDPDERMTWKSSAHLLRLGLNYKFSSGSGPVGVRY